MSEKKKIAIAGYASLENYGDTFIVKCNEYLINSLGKYDIILVDFEAPMNLFTKIIYYVVLVLSKFLGNYKTKAKLELLATKIRCYRYYKMKLRGTDAIVFAGGSLKYGTQKQWAYESMIVDIADKYNIPVMFNACNIQKYDAENWKCLYLTNRIKKSCVKMITSRDGEFGVKRLQDEYSIDNKIECYGVGDVAYWIPECYNIKKNNNSHLLFFSSHIDSIR